MISEWKKNYIFIILVDLYASLSRSCDECGYTATTWKLLEYHKGRKHATTCDRWQFSEILKLQEYHKQRKLKAEWEKLQFSVTKSSHLPAQEYSSHKGRGDLCDRLKYSLNVDNHGTSTATPSSPNVDRNGTSTLTSATPSSPNDDKNIISTATPSSPNDDKNTISTATPSSPNDDKNIICTATPSSINVDRYT